MRLPRFRHLFSVCQAGVDQCGSGEESTLYVCGPFFRDPRFKQYLITASVCEVRLEGLQLLGLLHGRTKTAEPAVVAMIIKFRASIEENVSNRCRIRRKAVKLS